MIQVQYKRPTWALPINSTTPSRSETVTEDLKYVDSHQSLISPALLDGATKAETAAMIRVRTRRIRAILNATIVIE
jgi:hypothetical protein